MFSSGINEVGLVCVRMRCSSDQGRRCEDPSKGWNCSSGGEKWDERAHLLCKYALCNRSFKTRYSTQTLFTTKIDTMAHDMMFFPPTKRPQIPTRRQIALCEVVDWLNVLFTSEITPPSLVV